MAIWGQGSPATTARRGVTVADVIEMTQIVTLDDDPLASFSPDGTRVIVVVKKGNFRDNTNEYSILLWKTKELMSGVPPRSLLTLGSSSTRPAIRHVRWLADSKTILFLGESTGELQQVHSLDTERSSACQADQSSDQCPFIQRHGRWSHACFHRGQSHPKAF